MSPSKSRSGKKWHPSILSRTKLCRGDSSSSQIDSTALVSLERKPSKSENSVENRSGRVLEMPEIEMGELEEEIRVLREQLGCAEAERNQVLDELREMTQVVQEANYLKEMLCSTRQELNARQRNIERLKSEIEKRDEVIERLEEEVEKRKLSESMILASFEHNKIELEAGKREISALCEKIKLMEEDSSGEKTEELGVAKESEKVALLKIESLTDELTSLKNELKLAIEAEEKSRKAMDVLASALKEVAEEATEAKETVKLKLSATQMELEQVKKENAKLKERVIAIEDKHRKDFEEAKKEMEIHRNAAERLRLEAEETLLAWNDKEMGFVSCIKRAEDERDNAQRESLRLRDILKQAISESNAAKAAANIAKDENSKLQDSLADKEDELRLLSQENERLKTKSRECQETES